MGNRRSQKPPSKKVKRLDVPYRLSSQHRIAVVNGMTANIGPQGRLDLAFWYEKRKLSDADVVEIAEDGSYKTVGRRGEFGLEKIVEVTLSVDFISVQEITKLLSRVVEQFEKAISEAREEAEDAENKTDS